MDDRTKTFYSFLIAGVAVSTAACGFTQQTKFQMSFLPSAPHAVDSDAETLPPPPAVQPNIYIQQTPSFLLAGSQLPARKTTGDALVMRAEQTFQQGKRFYQANDIPAARRQFDLLANEIVIQVFEERFRPMRFDAEQKRLLAQTINDGMSDDAGLVRREEGLAAIARRQGAEIVGAEIL